MATNSTVIKTLTANAYNGTFEATVNAFKVEGNFNTDGAKVIRNINGTVKQSNNPVLSFSAYKNGDTYRYNFSDIADLSVLVNAASAIGTAITAVEEELSNA